jgi:hypothetical protein
MLLSAVLVVCPTICASRPCCDAPAAEVEHSCCHDLASTCGESSQPANGPRPTSDSTRGVQCICGGAVVNDAVWHGVEMDVRWDLPAVVVPVLTLASVATHSVMHESLQPDIGESPGRAACILFSTMQC